MSKAKGVALVAAGSVLGAIVVGSVSASFGGGGTPCTGPTSVPDSGSITLQYERPSTQNSDRNDYKLSGTMRWDSQAALDCFSAGHVDWAYEHEIRYNEHFDRKIWNEDFGNIPSDAGPYVDNTAEDSGSVTTLSIGIFRPEKLAPGVTYSFSYELFLPNTPPNGLQPLALSGAVVEKNCSAVSPWCVGVPPADQVGPFTTLVGVERGFEVQGATCWAWQRSASPVPCDGTSAPTSPPPPTTEPTSAAPTTSTTTATTTPPTRVPATTSPPQTDPPVTSPQPTPTTTQHTTPPPPSQVTVYDTLASPPLGEFTCSRNNSAGSSWAIQTFVVPANVHVLTTVTVGVGARDGFTVALRRGGSQIASTRVGAGVDANIVADLGRIGATPGEALELWVGDADGWTNGGTRAASHLFSVVRTQADVYGSGNYRTTNNCPGQAPPAQSLSADMSARIVGWTR